MEEIKVQPNPSNGLEQAITYIKNLTKISKQCSSCINVTKGLEETREVVVRLKMMEWGIFGLGEASAGLYLAYHYATLGPYFGGVEGNVWPHNPLHEEPTLLEEEFHLLLTNVTFLLSNKTLKNFSLDGT